MRHRDTAPCFGRIEHKRSMKPRIFKFHFIAALVLILSTLPISRRGAMADDGQEDDAYGDAYDDQQQQAYDDDGNDGNDDGNDDANDDGNDDGIQYIDYGMKWSEYAILPKKCVKYNGKDVIIYSMYDDEYRKCDNKPIGTYYTSVSNFVTAYVNQAADNAAVLYGNDEYEPPDVTNYLECTAYQRNDDNVYIKLGCRQDSSILFQLMAYEDEYCTSPIQAGNNLNTNGFKIPFLQCQSCVRWPEYEDQELYNADDQFYANHEYDSPLCYGAWTYRVDCDRQCQRSGVRISRDGWSTADKFLLGVLSLCGIASLVGIYRKRKGMSKKEELLEQAAMSSAGLKKLHVALLILLYLIIVVLLMVARVKKLTWFLLVLIDFVLFGYWVNLLISSRSNRTSFDYQQDRGGGGEPRVGYIS